VPNAIETWRRVLELRGEDAEALAGLADLYERTEQWASSPRCSSGTTTSPPTTSRAWVCSSVARTSTASARSRRLALDDYARVLDIDYANLQALYAIADIWRRRNDASERRRRAAPDRGSGRGVAAPGEPGRDLP
jgi:hypothetical protein